MPQDNIQPHTGALKITDTVLIINVQFNKIFAFFNKTNYFN